VWESQVSAAEFIWKDCTRTKHGRSESEWFTAGEKQPKKPSNALTSGKNRFGEKTD